MMKVKRERDELLKMARELQENYECLADDLDKHYFNANVAQVSGNVAGFIGSGVAIASVITAPFTAGVSLVLFWVGFGVGVAATGTSVGSLIFRFLIEKWKLRKMNAKWKKFETSLRVHLKNPSPPPPRGDAERRVATGYRIAIKVADTAADGIGAVIGGVGAKAIKALGRVGGPMFSLNVFAMGLTVYEIVAISKELHRREKSAAGMVPRELAKKLGELIKCLEENVEDDVDSVIGHVFN